ncbi:MAG: mechanosensitive ion channel family protein [Terracidiphilus sp.]
MGKVLKGWLVAVMICALTCALAGAQQNQNKPPPAANPAAIPGTSQTNKEKPAEESHPHDPLGRETPYGAVMGFLRAAEHTDYPRAAKYLDSRKPEEAREELAMQLKALLDLGTSTDLNALSHVPEGDVTDNARPTREKVGVVETPDGPLDILLDRVQQPGDQQPVWLFSQETLRHVPEAYESAQSVARRDLVTYFPAWMSRFTLFSIPLSRWVLALGTLVALVLLALLLTRIVLALLKWALHGRLKPAIEAKLLDLRGPIFGLTAALGERALGGYAMTVLGRHRLEQAALVTGLISATWLLIRLTDVLVFHVRQQFTMRMQIEHATIVDLLGRIFKILATVVLVIVLLTMAGVNVSALVAGLGIGGVALALAAQKTLADLFGGISVIMRGAVRVGDLCIIGDKQGTVEEIGISSLRMRTSDRTVVTIPNSKVAEGELENFSMRDRFWIHQTFTLRFDTTYSVVRKLTEGMLDVLKTRPDIDMRTARVRVINLTNAGPQVEVSAYYRKAGSDFAAFLEEQEQIILAMMRLVEDAGTAIVAPVGLVNLQGAEKKAQ